MTGGRIAAAIFAVLATVLAAVLPGAAPARADPPPSTAAGTVTVFAAASLKTAMDVAAAAFTRRTGIPVVVSYGASSALARQIEAGAPADLFLSADAAWMDHLEGTNRIAPGSRTDLFGNRLVLIGRSGGPVLGTLSPATPLTTLLGEGRLAVALVDAVPAGRYARAALERLGHWPGVKDRLAQAENVRAALALVARGEAPLGVVYATDARAEPRVAIVATIPAEAHPPIVYPGALTRRAGPGAATFLRYLSTPEGAAPFAAEGFAILPPPA